MAIYADEKASKLSSQFASYISKIKYVEEVKQEATNKMMDVLDAYKCYNLGAMNYRVKQVDGTTQQVGVQTPTRRSYGVGY